MSQLTTHWLYNAFIVNSIGTQFRIPMPDYKAFLRAICDNPDDDAPRLVYADWLEELGDPRGEFIRISCERANLPPFDPRRRHWTLRLDELQVRHDLQWRDGLPHLAGVTWGAYQRGFIESVTVSGAEPILRRANVLFAAAPIQTLVARYIDADEPATFLGCPHLLKLRKLDLHGNEIGDKGAALLAGCSNLASLTHLFLSENQIGLPGAQALADSPYLGNLRVLVLHRNPIGNSGALALANSSRLKQTELLVNDSSIGLEAREELRCRLGAGK